MKFNSSLLQRHSLIILVLLLVCTIEYAQAQTKESNYRSALDLGKELYAKQLYHAAIQQFDDAIDLVNELPFHSAKDLLIDSYYYKALSELYIHPIEGEESLNNFIRKYKPDYRVHLAGNQLGTHYYNTRQYDEAIVRFSEIDPNILSSDQKNAYHFKFGYCLFLKKRFREAEDVFKKTKHPGSPFYHEAAYYSGMCAYFLDHYEDATRHFELAASDSKYAPLVPFYLAQIYFSMGQYNLLIGYTEQQLKKPGVKKVNELHQLLGQSYYEKKEYAKALEHLEFFEQHSSKMTEAQFYQLAYTQYRNQKYPAAISNFIEIASSNSEIGQNSNYYLADCYLRTNNKQGARTSFKTASQLEYLPAIKENALFHYGRLSAEMEFSSDAISALLLIPKTSDNYLESQNLLGVLFLESKDYDKTIQVLKNLPSLTEELKRVYQKVHFAKAIQHYNNGSIKEAQNSFTESLNTQVEQSLTAQALYWISDIKYKSNDFKGSLEDLENYFYVVDRGVTLPEQSSIPMGRYLKGHNLLSQKKFASAAPEFDKASKGLSGLPSFSKKNKRTRALVSDAMLRAADSYFRIRNYKTAIDRYEAVFSINMPNSDYAMYQKSIIEGLEGNIYDKIITLEELIQAFPSSKYHNNSLMDLGDSYAQLGNPGKAENSYRRILFNNTGGSRLVNEANLKLGLIQYNAGDLNAALRFYKDVFLNNPSASESKEALLAIEEILIRDLGNSKEYVDFMESIPGMSLGEIEKDSISFTTGRIQFENKNYPVAIRAFDEYLNKYPKGYYHIEAMYMRAESKSLQENFADALMDYENIVKFGKSEFYLSSLQKAALICFNEEENFTKSLQYYSSLHSELDDPEKKYDAGLNALRSAYRVDDRESVLNYSSLVINHANSSSEEKAFAHFCKGKNYYKVKDFENALLAFSNSADLSQNVYSIESKFRIAEIHFLLGDITKAEVQAQKAYKESAQFQYWVGKNVLILADVYISKDDLLSARAALEAIVEQYTIEDEMLSEARTKLSLVKSLQEEQNRIFDPEAQDTVILEKNKNND